MPGYSPTSLPFIMRLEKDGLQTFATITINFVNPDPIVGEFIGRMPMSTTAGFSPLPQDGLAGNMGTLTIGGGFFPPTRNRNGSYSENGGDNPFPSAPLCYAPRRVSDSFDGKFKLRVVLPKSSCPAMI